MSNTINYRKIEAIQGTIDIMLSRIRFFLDTVDMNGLNVDQLEKYSAYIQNASENFSKAFKMYEKETLEERDGEHIVVKAGVNEDICMSYLLKDVEFRRFLREKQDLIGHFKNEITQRERSERIEKIQFEIDFLLSYIDSEHERSYGSTDKSEETILSDLEKLGSLSERIRVLNMAYADEVIEADTFEGTRYFDEEEAKTYREFSERGMSAQSKLLDIILSANHELNAVRGNLENSEDEESTEGSTIFYQEGEDPFDMPEPQREEEVNEDRIATAREVAVEARLQNGTLIRLRGTQPATPSVDTNTNDEKTHNEDIGPQRPSR